MFITRITPFLQLCRFHRPVGIWLLFIPCCWGLVLASPSLRLFDFLLFLVGSVSMRAAGCVINDLADQDFDKAVERTKSRPLAAGLVTRTEAFLCFLGLCLVGLGVFYFLSFQAKIASLFAFFLSVIYPWMKRITHWPQLILGLAFNSGVLIAWGHCGKSFGNFLPWLFFGVGVLWTLVYDTIYAFQDIDDDLKIGVKSTAILFQDFPKFLPFFCLILIGCGLSVAGLIQKWSIFYFVLITCLFIYSIHLLKGWNPNSAAVSLRCFKKNQWVGWLIFLALFVR